MFLAMWNYMRSKKRNAFRVEMASALGKLNQRDQDLLCRAFSQPATTEGLLSVLDMTRSEVAEHCNMYYVHVSGGKWSVEDALRRVIHSARTGK